MTHTVLDSSHNPAHRRMHILQSALILALPSIVSSVMLGLYRLFDPSIATTVVPPGAMPSWIFPILPFVLANGAALVLLRRGHINVSALVLLTFWTFSTTGVIMRFGAHTVFPAMLILPISASSLMFSRRTSLLLALISAVVVALSAWIHMHRVGFGYQDIVTGQIITTAPRLQMMFLIAVVFWVSLFFAVALITSILAGNLQRLLTQSATQATALQELREQLEERVAQQTTSLLAGEREQAMLAERTRLARDIHDTLAQGLTGIIVQIGAAQQAMRAQHPDATEHIDLAARMARESLAEARRLVWNLRAEALERGDLRHALRGLVERFHHPHIHATCVVVGRWYPLPLDTESALLRVTQEALANVSRHTIATRVTVTLTSAPDTITLEIRDNGQGFGAILDGMASTHVHFGIMGMRERLHALNGMLALYDDNGAVVCATIPTQEV